MAFYGSIFSNESPWADGRHFRHARHIACPQRLKYIHNIKDGYIPYVEDTSYANTLTNENSVKKSSHFGLYNAMHDWRQELMGLARQVQSSLVVLNETQQLRTVRSSKRPNKRVYSSIPNYRAEDYSEENITKRLSNRRQTKTNYALPLIAKPRIPIDAKEPEQSTDNENQDHGIWLLPILCHILHVDNISEAQEWLVNANFTEKRLAMELISRTMQDMQNHDNSLLSDSPTNEQPVVPPSLNNLYWPYKFWQHQQQSKPSIDSNDTCERATSPVRILTPARRVPTSNPNDRASTNSGLARNQTPQTTNTTSHIPDIWRPQTSRVMTPMTADSNSDRLSRRSHRITTTSRSVSTDNDNNSRFKSAGSRGKVPLV